MVETQARYQQPSVEAGLRQELRVRDLMVLLYGPSRHFHSARSRHSEVVGHFDEKGCRMWY